MKITGNRTLWSGQHIEAVLLTYEDARGGTHTWEAVRRLGVDGVVIVVPVTRDGELVLIRQYRPAIDGYVIELPAGLIERGEDALDTARRELIEETGFRAGHVEKLTEAVMSTGINSEIWQCVLATGVEPATEAERAAHKPDACEDITPLTAGIGNIFEFLEQRRTGGDNVDVRILGLVELAKRRLQKA